ncbi:MAG TPA: glycosyl hydrolase, partial [Polyangiaceae bacterium]|nr:glycosyl hydrolase [Polyangiaceae bacterium]
SPAALGTSSAASAGAFVDLRATGRVDFLVSVESTAEYSLKLSTVVPGAWGSKVNDLYVNERRVGSFTTQDQDGSGRFYDQVVGWVPLREGNNTISIRANWGWIRVDYLELTAVNDEFKEVDAGLINPKASANARRLMQYLVDQYGSGIIAGQQDLATAATVHQITGKDPALISFDFIEYSPSRVARGSRTSAAQDAIGWWQDRHGIVSVMWHWNAPSGLYDDPGREWWRGFYTAATAFDVSAAMSDPASVGYGELVRDIDAIAEKLQALEDADVPVLFRPLHEASGGWFWWGARGPAAYLQLWNLVYDRLTDFHGLDNLIWVWNGQAKEWYPGDARVDIVSEDIYDGPRNYAPQSAAFAHATTYSVKPKLVALSENGALLDPDLLATSNANWSWFCVWSGQDFIGNETWNENSMLQKVYQHPRVITLDELPDLAAYPLP